MSRLTFDPTHYCERLAKACPERFRFITDNLSPGQWSLVNANYSREAFFHSHWLACNVRLWQGELWKFLGPLADERKIQAKSCVNRLRNSAPEHALRWRSDSRLESLMSAVVESFEMPI